jgi:hypothetical protein
LDTIIISKKARLVKRGKIWHTTGIDCATNGSFYTVVRIVPQFPVSAQQSFVEMQQKWTNETNQSDENGNLIIEIVFFVLANPTQCDTIMLPPKSRRTHREKF